MGEMGEVIFRHTHCDFLRWPYFGALFEDDGWVDQTDYAAELRGELDTLKAFFVYAGQRPVPSYRMFHTLLRIIVNHTGFSESHSCW